MSKGVKIAKVGNDIHASSDKIYVDSTTPLLKVALAGSGFMISDGASRNMKWRGQYQGTTTDDGNGYFFTVKVPHGLGYTPMSVAFADRNPGANRQYCTNIAAGIGVNAAIIAFASCDATNLTLQFSSTGIGPPVPPPTAGEYGYFFYVFYNRIPL